MIDLFTEDEVSRARSVIATSMDLRQRHQRLFDEIVTPEVMARIDAATGQANNRDYMAYRVEYLAGKA